MIHMPLWVFIIMLLLSFEGVLHICHLISKFIDEDTTL